MKAKIFKAPEKVPDDDFTTVRLFLAGSIDMGQAEDWQQKVTEELKDCNVIICNPRRDDWDKTQSQTADNPVFKQQVDWELENQENADVILMVLTADSKAPISLLELGLFAYTGKLIVYCHENFYRKGNIDIVCSRYDIDQVESLDDAINIIKDICR